MKLIHETENYAIYDDFFIRKLPILSGLLLLSSRMEYLIGR